MSALADVFTFYVCVLCAGSLITITTRLRASGAIGDWWCCFCENCRAPLPFWHSNLPVVSFVWLRGRSACCQQKVSWTHPLLEVVIGAALFATWKIALASVAP